MPLYAYGEDALTYSAISSGLPALLRDLGDNTNPGEAVVFFRPSFGRGSGRQALRTAAFGEFDAIIGTATAVYLVEAKWSRSGETWGKRISFDLRPSQIRRHRVFAWYLRRWRERLTDDWDQFAVTNVRDFEAEFAELTIAGSTTHLHHNLRYVLDALENCGDQIVDVVLYLDIDGIDCPPCSDSSFKVVQVRRQGADASGFFQMT